jgi:hypothetical protein
MPMPSPRTWGTAGRAPSARPLVGTRAAISVPSMASMPPSLRPPDSDEDHALRAWFAALALHDAMRSSTEEGLVPRRPHSYGVGPQALDITKGP